ncbi:MAG: hypothetical protein WA982_01630, partial [Rubrobacteraceae bacterium]
MSDAVVFALDIGTYKIGVSGQILAKTTTAWCRLDDGVANLEGIEYSGTPAAGCFEVPAGQISSKFECGRSIKKLAEAIAEDLESERRISLGFEAPMWLPLEHEHSPNLSFFGPRFKEERRREWYLQAGAAATVKAISLGTMLRKHLSRRCGKVGFVTKPDPWSPKTIILFE